MNHPNVNCFSPKLVGRILPDNGFSLLRVTSARRQEKPSGERLLRWVALFTISVFTVASEGKLLFVRR